jgi:hypothetical protein
VQSDVRFKVHDDALTKPTDVQQIFDNVPVNDKKLFWIEGSTRRWDGYGIVTLMGFSSRFGQSRFSAS